MRNSNGCIVGYSDSPRFFGNQGVQCGKVYGTRVQHHDTCTAARFSSKVWRLNFLRVFFVDDIPRFLTKSTITSEALPTGYARLKIMPICASMTVAATTPCCAQRCNAGMVNIEITEQADEMGELDVVGGGTIDA